MPGTPPRRGRLLRRALLGGSSGEKDPCFSVFLSSDQEKNGRKRLGVLNKGSEKGSEKGVSTRRCLERPLEEYAFLSVRLKGAQVAE